MTGIDHAAPTGVVTFLFTDIEGSTRRWEADAEQMRAALKTHDRLLRETVAAQKGWVFKHTGDGVCAAFSSPRGAVEAAVAAQRGLELPVRMGIATGEAELRGGDYFGTVLNRAARVMAAGHGGQILLDGTTAGLISGIDLVDLGPRRLRDIASPVQVFQVHSPGLRTEFPPLTTADPTPGNLRSPGTSLIGRESEIAGVGAALRTHRLVTLIGVGGVGKTRLALEVASTLVDEFPDGVWLFELAAVTDPLAVPDAVAAVLGITQQPGKTVSESVATALEGRVRLLVLDNCEHVRDAAADLFEAIVAQSASMRILATSREGLGVPDEQLWLVPSLDVGTGVDSAAVNLFVDRARSAASRFSLSNADEADAVVEICRRLDGIPLAIELAASRMQSMTATEVRDRLDDRFRLLVGSRRALERHQTLRHAVQWSYDLLDDAEKSLLDRCSVFAGGFDLAGACAVADSGDEYATLDLLDSLVRKSLLVADHSSGRTRFSMLETIRQFAEEQLVQDGMADDTRAAHARYFAGREADVLALWDSARQREAYDWFTLELPNLRAAFRWAADRGDLDTAAAIAVYAPMLGCWVEQFEPVGWAEELVESARALNHRRLAQLYVMAAQCFSAGRVDTAVGYADAARQTIESGHFDEVPYEFETWLGGPYTAIGQPERWVALCRNMIAGTAGVHAYARGSLVLALSIAGASDEAVAAADGLLDAAEASSNPLVVSFACMAYGFAHRDAAPRKAYEVLRRGLAIARDSRNRQIETHLAVILATLAGTQREPVDALDFLTVAIRNFYDAGSIAHFHNSLAILAVELDRLGNHVPAATISGCATSTYSRTGTPEINPAIAHLSDVLGDETYQSLASAGAKMTNAAMAGYAFGQIDLARAQLAREGESR